MALPESSVSPHTEDIPCGQRYSLCTYSIRLSFLIPSVMLIVSSAVPNRGVGMLVTPALSSTNEVSACGGACVCMCVCGCTCMCVYINDCTYVHVVVRSRAESSTHHH